MNVLKSNELLLVSLDELPRNNKRLLGIKDETLSGMDPLDLLILLEEQADGDESTI